MEFVQGASDGSPILHEEHSGIFNIQQLVPADGTSSLTYIRGMIHTLINHPTCETLGRQFVAGSGFKPRPDNLEASVRT